jgi:hypothetical protein
MSLRRVLAELRRRGVLKVAAVYAAVGWVSLQSLSLLFESFDAPDWVIKVVTTLVILGFPVACLMSWGFDITPEGVRPIPPAPKDPVPVRSPFMSARRQRRKSARSCAWITSSKAAYVVRGRSCA